MVFSSYAHLMTMLAQGWQIESPVYIRPRWRSPSHWEKVDAYHFVLWNGDKVHLVSLRDCPEMQQFLAENRLTIDRL